MSQQDLVDINFKALNGQINIDEAQGIVECFVAAIGNKDSVGDVVVTGAFTESLKRRKPRVVWGHNWNDPIGKVLEIYEVPANDPRLPMKMKQAGVGGLYAKVQFNLAAEKGREAFTNVAFFGQEQEWSIGYKTINATFDPNMQANILREVELYEVSPVLHGANQLTATLSVKSEEQEKCGMPGWGGGPGMTKPMAMANLPEISAVMPGLAVIAPQREDIFAEGESKPLGDESRNRLEMELASRSGSKLQVISATENMAIFDRLMDDGSKVTYRLPYHYEDGSQQYMFGKPERMTPSAGPGTQGRPVVVPSQMPSMPMAVKPNPAVFGKSDIASEFDIALDLAIEGINSGEINEKSDKDKLNQVLEVLQKYAAEQVEPEVEEFTVKCLPQHAFKVKSILDPILEHHRLEAEVDEFGVHIKGYLTPDASDALYNAETALRMAISKEGGPKKVGKSLASAEDTNVKALGPKVGERLSGGLRAAPSGMSFVDITGTTDADTDGIVFEGKPGLERPIIPRFLVPKDLARKISKLTEGDALEIEKKRRSGDGNIAFDEGKLRSIITSVGGDSKLLESINAPASNNVSGREMRPIGSDLPFDLRTGKPRRMFDETDAEWNARQPLDPRLINFPKMPQEKPKKNPLDSYLRDSNFPKDAMEGETWKQYAKRTGTKVPKGEDPNYVLVKPQLRGGRDDVLRSRTESPERSKTISQIDDALAYRELMRDTSEGTAFEIFDDYRGYDVEARSDFAQALEKNGLLKYVNVEKNRRRESNQDPEYDISLDLESMNDSELNDLVDILNDGTAPEDRIKKISGGDVVGVRSRTRSVNKNSRGLDVTPEKPSAGSRVFNTAFNMAPPVAWENYKDRRNKKRGIPSKGPRAVFEEPGKSGVEIADKMAMSEVKDFLAEVSNGKPKSLKDIQKLQSKFDDMASKLQGDFTGMDFSNTDLTGINFGNHSFNNVNFSGTNLTDANFTNTNIHGSSFENANLTNANLSLERNIKDPGGWDLDFSGANLTGANFTGRNMNNTVFNNTNFENANFSEVNLRDADFTNCDLSNIGSLKNASLQGSNFEEANLSGVDLSKTGLENASFRNANLSGTNFTGAKTRETNFSGADLSNADMTSVDFNTPGKKVKSINNANLEGALVSELPEEKFKGKPNVAGKDSSIDLTKPESGGLRSQTSDKGISDLTDGELSGRLDDNKKAQKELEKLLDDETINLDEFRKRQNPLLKEFTQIRSEQKKRNGTPEVSAPKREQVLKRGDQMVQRDETGKVKFDGGAFRDELAKRRNDKLKELGFSEKEIEALQGSPYSQSSLRSRTNIDLTNESDDFHKEFEPLIRIQGQLSDDAIAELGDVLGEDTEKYLKTGKIPQGKQQAVSSILKRYEDRLESATKAFNKYNGNLRSRTRSKLGKDKSPNRRERNKIARSAKVIFEDMKKENLHELDDETLASKYGITRTGQKSISDGTDVLMVDDVETALAALANGYSVEVKNDSSALFVGNYQTELKKMIDSVLKKSGSEKDKNKHTVDLCRLYLAGKNLFCGEHIGVEREQMPQLGGRTKGDNSPAMRALKAGLIKGDWKAAKNLSEEDKIKYDSLVKKHASPKNKVETLTASEKKWLYEHTDWNDTEVKLEDQFLDHVKQTLDAKDINGNPVEPIIQRTGLPTDFKASQKQLQAEKIDGMTEGIMEVYDAWVKKVEGEGIKRGSPEFMKRRADFLAGKETVDINGETKKAWWTSPLLSTRDGYILDGHHRWAAITLANMNLPKDEQMDVTVNELQTNIIEGLSLGKSFQDHWGIKEAKLAGEDMFIPDANAPSMDKSEFDAHMEDLADNVDQNLSNIHDKGTYIKVEAPGITGNAQLQQRALELRPNGTNNAPIGLRSAYKNAPDEELGKLDDDYTNYIAFSKDGPFAINRAAKEHKKIKKEIESRKSKPFGGGSVRGSLSGKLNSTGLRSRSRQAQESSKNARQMFIQGDEDGIRKEFKSLLERRDALEAESRKMLDKAYDGKKDLTDAEHSRMDEIDAELSDVNGSIQGISQWTEYAVNEDIQRTAGQRAVRQARRTLSEMKKNGELNSDDYDFASQSIIDPTFYDDEHWDSIGAIEFSRKLRSEVPSDSEDPLNHDDSVSIVSEKIDDLANDLADEKLQEALGSLNNGGLRSQMRPSKKLSPEELRIAQEQKLRSKKVPAKKKQGPDKNEWNGLRSVTSGDNRITSGAGFRSRAQSRWNKMDVELTNDEIGEIRDEINTVMKKHKDNLVIATGMEAYQNSLKRISNGEKASKFIVSGTEHEEIMAAYDELEKVDPSFSKVVGPSPLELAGTSKDGKFTSPNVAKGKGDFNGKPFNNGAPADITPRQQQELVGWARKQKTFRIAQGIVKSHDDNDGTLTAKQWNTLKSLHASYSPTERTNRVGSLRSEVTAPRISAASGERTVGTGRAVGATPKKSRLTTGKGPESLPDNFDSLSPEEKFDTLIDLGGQYDPEENPDGVQIALFRKTQREYLDWVDKQEKLEERRSKREASINPNETPEERNARIDAVRQRLAEEQAAAEAAKKPGKKNSGNVETKAGRKKIINSWLNEVSKRQEIILDAVDKGRADESHVAVWDELQNILNETDEIDDSVDLTKSKLDSAIELLNDYVEGNSGTDLSDSEQRSINRAAALLDEIERVAADVEDSEKVAQGTTERQGPQRESMVDNLNSVAPRFMLGGGMRAQTSKASEYFSAKRNLERKPNSGMRSQTGKDSRAEIRAEATTFKRLQDSLDKEISEARKNNDRTTADNLQKLKTIMDRQKSGLVSDRRTNAGALYLTQDELDNTMDAINVALGRQVQTGGSRSEVFSQILDLLADAGMASFIEKRVPLVESRFVEKYNEAGQLVKIPLNA